MSERKTKTYCTVAGVDHDDVTVVWELERAEPDVNFAGGVTVYWVNSPTVHGDLLADMTADEVEDLEQRLMEDAYPDPDAYGDYLYQLRKDEGMRA
jgi:hypothetical protein